MAPVRSLLILKTRLDSAGASSTKTVRPTPASIELLEARRLLSASPASLRDAVVSAAAATSVVGTIKTYGVTLSLQAGQSFTGYLGVVTGAHVSGVDRISATINWGDGKQSGGGVVSISTSGHIDVGGTHTYSAGGAYTITISVFEAPLPASRKPTPTLLGTIHSKAVVAGKSTGGLEIAETANVQFTAKVGSFQFPAPAQGLSATIDWGDGATSAAKLKATSGVGVDLIRFEVDGTHTYAKPGEFPIHIVVVQALGAPGSGAPVKRVTTIDSKAVVTTAITGAYKVADSVPDVGATYGFTGAGITGNLPLTFTGSVTTPGMVSSGRAAGTLTLKTSEGTLAFKVSGPVESGFGPFPSTLSYVIAGSSGGFSGTTGSGTFSVTLNTSRQTFILTINPTQ